MDLRKELFENQDLQYRDFHSKLIPNTDKNKIIGVRVPVLRKIAKRAVNEECENECCYYEEKLVKGFVAGYKKCSLNEHLKDIADFIPLIDNWAICDMAVATFKFTEHHQDEMLPFILSYIYKSEYESRFAIVMLMSYYIDDEHIDMVLDILKEINRDEYYINMAIGWALATAYVKYERKVTALLKKQILNPDVQNKTIQKIRESLQVERDKKDYLKIFKI